MPDHFLQFLFLKSKAGTDIFFILQKVTGVSGLPGADAQLGVEGIRTGDGFVMTPHLVTEGHTVQENRVRRKDALNVETGVVLEVHKPARLTYTTPLAAECGSTWLGCFLPSCLISGDLCSSIILRGLQH